MNMTTGYVITRKNSRHAHAATGNSRDHVLTATTIRADGTYLPHFFILAGKRSKSEHVDTSDGRIKGTPPGSSFVMTEKGYMTDVAYDKYADHLINHLSLRDNHGAPNSRKLWSLLVCDGYNSHVMLPDVLEKFWKAAIYITSFPSHTSSELQPLDINLLSPCQELFASSYSRCSSGERPSCDQQVAHA